MVNFMSKRMTLGVKSDILMLYTMENVNGIETCIVGGKVSPT
jgi:hypothetical protein